MTAKELAQRAIDIANNYKTLYVMGCFGAPLNERNKQRYCNNHAYNKQANRTKLIKAATPDTFGFDCVCLIKGILWGWSGDTSKTYGGAAYNSNGVPDIGADSMIKCCADVTTDFTEIEVGEAVWCTGHIGIYIGDGLAVECTPSWKNCVQITAVSNIGKKSGYAARKWTKHGKLPYVTYTEKTETPKKETTAPITKPKKTVIEAAKSYSKSYSKAYKVNARNGLNMRSGAGTNKAIITTLKNGEKFRCYGYYTKQKDGTVWLYGVDRLGRKGYCSIAYLT